MRGRKHPIPTLDEVIADMNGVDTFSKIDLNHHHNKGYQQLEVHSSSCGITTFTTHKGLYRYKRLCFGINIAGEIFRKNVSEVIQNIPGVRNISDNIIVYTKGKDHLDTLKSGMQRLIQHNVTISREKCFFCCP